MLALTVIATCIIVGGFALKFIYIATHSLEENPLAGLITIILHAVAAGFVLYVMWSLYNLLAIASILH